MKVLVTGGTGFIGKQIIHHLIERGHNVINLTTRKEQAKVVSDNLKHVFWNPEKEELDTHSIQEIQGVIHLAGFSVANKWTKANKELMISSRILSTKFLCKILNEMSNLPSVFICASASGFYANSNEIQEEDASVGAGFLASLTEQWEQASSSLHFDIKKIHLRIGVVLSAKDGALKKLTPLFNWGLGSAVGTGKQYMSWVHESDLVHLFTHSLENNIPSGPYNATSDLPVTNTHFSKTLANVLKKPFLLPNAPAFVLRILFGEMSQLVLVSQRLSNKKITSTGFSFRFKTIEDALTNIYGKEKN